VIAESAELYDSHIERGLRSRARRDWDSAAHEFRAACGLRPESLGARCELAFTYLEAGALDDAQAAYLSVYEIDRCNVDALAGLGEIGRCRGELPAALHYLQQAFANAPERSPIASALAAVLRDLGRYQEAAEVLQSVLARDPADWAALVGLGLLARCRGDDTGAAALFAQALRYGPGHAGMRLELALSLSRAGRLDEAEVEYRAVLERDAFNVEALAGLAAVRKQAGDVTAALGLLRTAVEHRPDDAIIRLDYAATLRELSHLDEAEAECRLVAQSHPAHWMALVGLALVARVRGDHDAARLGFERALALQPAHEGLQSELALTFRHLGWLDEAEQLYLRMAEADPRAAAPLEGLSLIAVARGDPDAAISWALAACELEPKPDHKLLLSSIYRDAGRPRDAAAVIDEVLLAVPKHAGAWLERGLLLRSTGDHPGALASFEHALSTGAQRALIEVAGEHFALGSPDRARAAYERVLAGEPINAQALLGMAELAMHAFAYHDCLTLADVVIAAYPMHLDARRQKCRALCLLDRADEALRIAEELDTIATHGSDEADAVRLEILRTCGRRTEAEQLLSRARVDARRHFGRWFEAVMTRLAFYDIAAAKAALEAPPAVRPQERARVLYLTGVLADLEWRADDAKQAFEQALAISAGHAEIHEHLARLYFLQTDVGRCQQHLQAMIDGSASRRQLGGESCKPSQTLVGQLLNELRLDRDVLSRLVQLWGERPEDRIEPLFETARSAPALTPPAIYLLMTLRALGGFAPMPPPAEPTPSPIPARLVQYWDQEEPPQDIVRLMRTWSESHRDYEYCRFDDQAARAYLRAHYPASVSDAYAQATHPAQASDIFRLAYLYREGGFYIDADDRCIGVLSSLVPAHALLLVYQEQYGTLGNNFIGCVAGEPVIGRALTLAVESLNRGDTDSIWLATGPGLLTRAFAELLTEQGSDWRGWLQARRILDRCQLSQVSLPHHVARYKQTSRSWLRSPSCRAPSR
jgi:tetratricopeptide (TPR) repeat protein